MRTKLDGGIGAKQFAHEKLKRALQICDADVFIDIETFDLVNLRAVSRVHLIAAISGAGRDDPDRPRPGPHRANLYGGRAGPPQSAVRYIKSVLFVARRSLGRRVRRVEAR